MGVNLSKGGNVSLSKEAPGLTAVTVGLGWDARSTTGDDFDLDASALMLDQAGKVLSDKHFIFFNNTTSPDGSVAHAGDNRTGEGDGDDEAITVDLAAVPADVDKIVFPVSVYEAEARQQGFGQVRNAFIRVVNQDGGAELARYDLTEDASTETAMVFGELYRNGAEWKFRAVGQGYSSGLSGIARDFPASRSEVGTPTVPIDYRKPPAPAAATRPAPARPVGLTKVTLTKAAPTVSLAKQSGALHVNLNWDARPAAAQVPAGKGGFLTKLKAAAAAATTLDLDLGCLWELTDGSKGVIQSLGNQFGAWDEAPYVTLDGDDRSGAVSGGENLDVNLAHAADISRVLVFASIYQGAKGFGEAGGVVTLSPGQGPDVVVHLDADGGTSRMCAVALLEFDRGVVTVRREVKFVKGAQDVLDREYGWGMNWKAGRK